MKSGKWECWAQGGAQLGSGGLWLLIASDGDSDLMSSEQELIVAYSRIL